MKCRSVLPILVLTVSLGLGTAAFGDIPEDADYAGDTAYARGDYGRVRYEENGPEILRGSEGRLESEGVTAINTPIFPGDRVRTGGAQRIEVQLASGTVVRADRGTDLIFQAMPEPSSEYGDTTLLRLDGGTIQITALIQKGEDFRVDTPSTSIYLLGDGDFRVDVDDRGRTHVASRRGVAEVAGEGGSVLVRAGMRTSIDAGSVPEDPRAFSTFVSDDFDAWIAMREDSSREPASAEVTEEVYEDLPYEVRPYYRELAVHGRWVYSSPYGYVWYPVDSSPGWRPYHDGYWTYGPGGYFWVSSEPWGWAPYHYGRWSWIGGHGWCWVPGHVFGGAWVSWYWGPSHFGWCPLDYWNRPAYFHASLHLGIFDPHCWSFVGYGNIHHAVPFHEVQPVLRASAVVTRPVRVAPGQLVRDPGRRQAAIRELVSDRRAQLMPNLDRGTRPTRSFVDVERSFRRTAAPPVRGTSTARERPGSFVVSPPGTRAPVAVDRNQPVSRNGASFPRRLTGTDAPARNRPQRGPVAVDRNQPAPRRMAGADAPARNRPGAVLVPQQRGTDPGRQIRVPDPRRQGVERSVRQGNDASERVRDMYRRMASPRTPSAPRMAPAPRPQTPQPQAARPQPSRPPSAGRAARPSQPVKPQGSRSTPKKK